MNEKRIEKIRDIIDRRNKEEILKESCSEIKYTSNSKMQYIVSALIAIALGYLIGYSKDIVELIREIVENANGIFLAFIAIVFGSYSIFQALLSRDIIDLLISSDGHILKDSNRTFLNLTILYTVGIVINFVFSVILKILPNDFLLVDNVIVCNIISWIGITIYLFLHLLLFSEMINFAINLYRMFCVYNAMKALDSVDNDEENE